jgi:DNA mismatch repair protein MutL
MQSGNKYIAFTTAEGMVLLHQRRAHKRILFEYFSTVLSKNKGQSQQLLFPKEIHLNKKDITIIKQLKVDLLSVGFSFEIQENDSIALLGIPTECQEENLQFVIESLIEQHKNNEQLQTAQHNDLANSLANSLAINEQKKLSTQEMLTLKTELLKCSTPSVCPLGKATLINLQTADLEKYF